MEVNGVHQLFGYRHSSKYLPVFSRRKILCGFYPCPEFSPSRVKWERKSLSVDHSSADEW